jgi:branched-chain amino acid transport system ATP-binding protein
MFLEIRKLKSGYGKTQIIHDVSMVIDKKEIVALIGHNGAGKSTTLKAIFGILKPFGGSILYMDEDITHWTPGTKIRRGFCFIPQDQFIFDKLTVRENLEISTYAMTDKSKLESRFVSVYELFPILKQRSNQRAGTLSGGERRMLSLGAVLLMQPELLMLDEPSLGLSPIMVQHLMAAVAELRHGFEMTIFLVEQNVKQAFKLSNRVYVMKTGQIILEERADKLLERGEWWDLF